MVIRAVLISIVILKHSAGISIQPMLLRDLRDVSINIHSSLELILDGSHLLEMLLMMLFKMENFAKLDGLGILTEAQQLNAPKLQE